MLSVGILENLNTQTMICRNSLGGIKKFWIFPYVNYSNSEIVINDNVLVTFPTTTIYRFNYIGNPSPSETMETNEGGKFYNQSIGIDLQYLNDGLELTKLLNKDYRIIFQDNNGLYHIYGLYNGLESGALNYETGSGKSSLNGFKISFTAKEEKPSFFINNLEDAGFFDADFNFRITQNGLFRITQNDKYRITQ